MNKKLFALGMIAILLATAFVGCKKGENDPALSLLSRKARISGVWTLTSADYSYIKQNNNNTNQTDYTYDGTNLTETEDGDGVSYPYTETLTINKDGSFVYVTTEQHDDAFNNTYTETYTTEGFWYFVGGVDELEIKNKERVEFMVSKLIYSYSSGSTTFSTTDLYEGTSNNQTMLLLLDRLANKEMIVLLDEVTDNGDVIKTTSGTKTYTQLDEE